MEAATILPDVLLFIIPWIHVLISPYTKVEESFNLHATHDVLMYGVGPDALHQYDHFIFPGAVPRSFIGSVLLAWVSTPLLWMAGALGLLRNKLDIQITIRLVLATCNSLGLLAIRRAATKRFGPITGTFFSILTCSQFHLPYWVGRTLPNMFALLPVNLAAAALIDWPRDVKAVRRRIYVAVTLLTSAAVIFRTELVLLLAPTAFSILLPGDLPLLDLVLVGLVSGVASLGLTISVDSYFWRQFPLWPELASVYFNIYQGKSSDWGVSPFYTYFVAHLPKLLLGALPLSVFGATVDKTCRQLLVTPLVFLGLISCIGHKEWRFITYVVPVFNVAAARGATWIYRRRHRSAFSRLMALSVLAGIGCNFGVSVLLTRASSRNYPGGEALWLLNSNYSNITNAHVYIDNLAAQTGASLFLQTHSTPHAYAPASAVNWTYVKTENITEFRDFSHVVTEKPEWFRNKQWQQGLVVKAFAGRFSPRSVLLGGNLGELVLEEDSLWIFRQSSAQGDHGEHGL